MKDSETTRKPSWLRRIALGAAYLGISLFAAGSAFYVPLVLGDDLDPDYASAADLATGHAAMIAMLAGLVAAAAAAAVLAATSPPRGTPDPR